MNKNFVKNLSLWLLLGIFSGYLFLNLYQSENLPKTKQPSEVSIKGTEGLVLSFAKCCYPIPGDNILGHISQEKGIVVHKHDCRSIRKDKKATDEKIDLSWDENAEEQFNACIKVEVENSKKMFKTDFNTSRCFPHPAKGRTAELRIGLRNFKMTGAREETGPS